MIELGILNSSPLITLGKIDRLHLLKDQIEEILVPESVAAEVSELPDWADVVQPRDIARIKVFPSRIHRGEASVISLGLERPNAVLVIDDWYAREFAKTLELKVVGTVGLIVRAKRNGIIEAASPILDDLKEAGFHLSARILLEAKTLAGES